MDDYEMIYHAAMGRMKIKGGVPWVQDISGVGSAYNQALRDFWTAREHLCARFGLDWEDEDLELFMNGVVALEEAVARAMFESAIEFTKRGCRL